jgi:hypothetical protein
MAVLLLVSSISAALSPANTISQSQAFRLNSTASAASLSYNPFDTSLGTLQSIGISFDTTRRHALGIWNFSDFDGSVPFDATLKDTTLSLDGNIFGFADLHYGPGATPLPASTLPVFASEFGTGQAAFLAGLDPVFASAYQPAMDLTGITGSFVPSLAFAGILNLAYNPGSFNMQTTGNFISGSLVDVYGSAKVTYTYQSVASLPDSPLGPTVALLWFGMIAAVQIRRGKSSR